MNGFLLLSASLCCLALSQPSNAVIAAEDARPILLPTPKQVEWLEGRVALTSKVKAIACLLDATGSERAVATGISQLNERLRSLGGAVIPAARNADAAGSSDTILWVGTRREVLSHSGLLGGGFVLPKEMCVPDGYVLRCARVGKRDVLICAGYDARGCYYGIQTLIQLMSGSRGTISLPRVDITDWPSFAMRLIKTDSVGTGSEPIARWADMMPRYKMNVYASHYRPTEDAGSWRSPGPLFQANAETVARMGRERDIYDPLLYIGPFGKNRGSLLEPQLIKDYVAVLEARIAQGYKWLAFDFNDWGVYKNLTPEEQARFKDIGEVMAWLTSQTYDAIRSNHPEVGMVSIPAAGFYGGLPKPELIYYCKNIPKDILVMTTGPITRSRTITGQWLKDWTAATGRKPFLWDNTIYSHLDQYRPLVNGFYNLNAYDNSFPPDMSKMLAGPGIHLNGTAIRWREPGALTFLDYMWNPEAYDPAKSLRNAQILLWGKDAPDVANEAQQRAVELYDYVFKAFKTKGQGNRQEALAKLAELEKAVKRLADIIGDPVTSKEMDSQCIGQAARTLDKVFATKQTK